MSDNNTDNILVTLLQGLFTIIIWIVTLGLAYWGATTATKHLTGKHIHEHALDCLPAEFKNKIHAWFSQAAEGAKVHFRLLKDEGSVHGKRTLRAIGLWKDSAREPVVITEEVISLEDAMALGFDINITDDQELAYMAA